MPVYGYVRWFLTHYIISWIVIFHISCLQKLSKFPEGQIWKIQTLTPGLFLYGSPASWLFLSIAGVIFLQSCWTAPHCTSSPNPTHFFLPVILALGIFRGGFYIKSMFEQSQVCRLKTFLSIYNSTIRDLVLLDLHEVPLKKNINIPWRAKT